MAKRAAPQRRRKTEKRSVNWIMIGGIIVVGVVALFALLFATLQGQGVPTPTPARISVLDDYCAANEANCMEKGDASAPITIYEISDYACIHCRNFNMEGTAAALEQQYVESGQVRWVVVPYTTNDATRPVAEASFCAADQGAFFEYHEAMFGRFGMDGAYSRDGILAAARAAGVDLGAFESCVDSGEKSAALQSNLSNVSRSGVRVTPSFIIDGRLVEGNLPLSNFQQLIGQALES